MKSKRRKNRKDLLGYTAITFSLFLFISLVSFQGKHELNWLGLIGHSIAYLFRYTLGISDFLVAIYVFAFGIYILQTKSLSRWSITKSLHFLFFIISLSGLLNVISEKTDIVSLNMNVLSEERCGNIRNYLGGVPLYFLYMDIPFFNLKNLLSDFGVTIIFVGLTVVSIMMLFGIDIGLLISNFKKQIKMFYYLLSLVSKKIISLLRYVKNSSTIKEISLENKSLDKDDPQDIPDIRSEEVDLLVSKLKQTFTSFSIDARIGKVYVGPRVMLIEVHPSRGVKVQKIKTLENDIALNLKAKSIRIIAPIPGKAAVGIEIPSIKPQKVQFRDILHSYKMSKTNLSLPLLLGQSVFGNEIFLDITKMPHCLIAGATGSGKSACINTTIMSILMTSSPEKVKLILIDPKKVELTPFKNIPHLATPVITDPITSARLFSWLLKEMNYRYELFKRVGARHLNNFNNRKIDEEFEKTLEMPIPRKLPIILCIVDEFSDLILSLGSDIETSIVRIAQMSRAVGIHLILSTQRPSREVITGLIKANFPTKIAFKVSTRINSQIILDENGAESLLGSGDSLFVTPGEAHPTRCQCSLVDDEDINEALTQINGEPQYLVTFSDEAVMVDSRDKDTLYSQAMEIVISHNTASTTFLQRKLKIGYARAASLMDALEENGIVTPQEKNRRQVLKK